MPRGKPAGVRCVQLTADNGCALFGHPSRPAVCGRLAPHPDMCGADRIEALALLEAWERASRPD
jgi:hypothetical protein